LPTIDVSGSPARSRFISFLVSEGPQIRSFGKLVAPLGVEYIGLIKTVDWERYAWLKAQPDLQLVRDGPDITLFRNLAAQPEGYRATTIVDVPDWGGVVGLSNQCDTTGYAIRAKYAGPGPIAPPFPGCPSTLAPAGAVEKLAQTSYHVQSGGKGTF